MLWILGIILVALALAAIAFCIWYMRKDISSFLSLMEGFFEKRIKAKIKKIIGQADTVEEDAKKQALAALVLFKTKINASIDAWACWIEALNVIKKE